MPSRVSTISGGRYVIPLRLLTQANDVKQDVHNNDETIYFKSSAEDIYTKQSLLIVIFGHSSSTTYCYDQHNSVFFTRCYGNTEFTYIFNIGNAGRQERHIQAFVASAKEAIWLSCQDKIKDWNDDYQEEAAEGQEGDELVIAYRRSVAVRNVQSGDVLRAALIISCGLLFRILGRFVQGSVACVCGICDDPEDLPRDSPEDG